MTLKVTFKTGKTIYLEQRFYKGYKYYIGITKDDIKKTDGLTYYTEDWFDYQSNTWQWKVEKVEE